MKNYWLNRNPNRKIIYIDTSKLSPREVNNFLENLKEIFREKQKR